MDARRVPALLTTPEYIGTLAAARCLDAHGVRVVVASSGVLGPARWSRAVTRVVRSPSLVDPDAVLQWLLEFGAREPGAVLHPTSDELAWLVARNATALARVFRLYTAPFDAVRTLLDKAELHHAARDAGIAVPETFFPRDEDEAATLASKHGALLLKPRTQVFYTSHFKGRIVRGAEDTRDAWREYRRWPHATSVRADVPEIDQPLLQQLVRADGVYSIAGFVSRDGTVLALRASRKVLQRPREAGVGVSFEAADVDVDLARRIGILARHVGFFGAFEAEFVGSDRRLIDFNPRYYGQMGFDVARGAPLPWLLHLGALGMESSLVDAAASLVEHPPRAYEDAIASTLMAATQRLTGTNAAPVMRARDHLTMDATFAADDPLPALASAASTFWSAARHPRGFWRSLRT